MYGARQRDPPRLPTSRGTTRSRAAMWGARGAVAAEAVVKGCVMEPLLQRCPSQQEPLRSMSVQGLVVPMMVQEGRWQVLMYTGTEKLAGEGTTERRAQIRRRPGPRLGAHTYFQSPRFGLGPRLLPQSRVLPPSDQATPSPSRAGGAFSLRGEPQLFLQGHVSLSVLPGASSLRPALPAGPPPRPAPHQRSFGHCPESRRSGPGDTGPVGPSPGRSPLAWSPRRSSTRCR